MIYIGGNNYGIATEGNLSIENLKFEFGEGAKAAQGVHTTRDVSNIQEAEVLPNTPEEAVKMALEWLMEERDEKGAYLFHKVNHWGVIYRILLDERIYTGSANAFSTWLKNIGIVNARVNLPTKDLSRNDINMPFDSWITNKDNSYDVKKAEIGQRFKSKLTELLPK